MRTKALLAILVSVVLFSFTFSAIKIGLQGIGPINFAALRMLFASLFLLGVVLITGKARQLTALFKGEYKSLIVLSLLGVVLFNVLQNFALGMTYSLSVGIIQGVMPLFVLVITHQLVMERHGLKKILGVIAGFVGAGLIVLGGADISQLFTYNVFWGNVLFVIAMFVAALYTVLSKKTLQHADAFVFTAAVSVLGFVMLLPFGILEGIPASVGLDIWLYAIYLGIAASGIAFWLYFYALRTEEATKVSTFLLFIPLLAAIIGVGLLQEPFGIQTAIGSALTILGVYLAQTDKFK